MGVGVGLVKVSEKVKILENRVCAGAFTLLGPFLGGLKEGEWG